MTNRFLLVNFVMSTNKTMKLIDKEIKKGTFGLFREYLNNKFSDFKYRNFQYHQKTRLYGDYLYFQDKAMFDSCLYEALFNEKSNNRFWNFHNLYHKN